MGKLANIYYPDLKLSEAIELVKKVESIGGRISAGGLAKQIGIDPRGAGFYSRVTDLKKYGLLEGERELQTTELAREIIAGNSASVAKAFLAIPLFAEMHNRLKGKEPPDMGSFQSLLREITHADPESITRRAARLRMAYVEALPYLTGQREQVLSIPQIGMASGSDMEVKHGLLMVPAEYETLEMRGNFIIGVKKDAASVELLDKQINTWIKWLKSQMGIQAKAHTEPKKHTEKKMPPEGEKPQ